MPEREYNAGQRPGRTFDDGQGARLLRPENRLPSIRNDDSAMKRVIEALVYAGIVRAQGAPDEAGPQTSSWPAWFYGPDGQSAIFNSESEVPEGWEDNPRAFAEQDEQLDENAQAGRQPRDAVVDDSFYEAMGEDELREQLDAKAIAYHPKAKKPTLISLLKTGKAAPNRSPEA